MCRPPDTKRLRLMPLARGPRCAKDEHARMDGRCAKPIAHRGSLAPNRASVGLQRQHPTKTQRTIAKATRKPPCKEKAFTLLEACPRGTTHA